tara:strand:- start:641 stop:2989 length:2349 start_codon:yes stop_codon:yes gene_type:complete
MVFQSAIKAGKAYVELAVSDQTKNGLNRVTRSMNRFGYRMSRLGRRMMMVGGALGIPLIAAARAFAVFERQMAEVSTMLNEPERHMRYFSSSVQKLSVEFGESTAVMAKGLYQILSATIDANKAIGVLHVSSKAAVAGLSDTTTAADLITTVLNSYGLAAEEAIRVSDILFATIKRGKTTFGELAQFMGKLTAVSAEVGVSFEEVSAVIALLTRNGIKTEVAVTAIRQALASLLKPASQSAEKFQELFNMSMNPDAIKRMGGLSGFLRKLAEESSEDIAMMFPNVRALMGVLPAASNSADLRRDVKAMQDSAGATDEAFEKMSETVSFQLGRLKQSFTVFLQTVGEALMPELKSFIEWFNEAAAGVIAFVKTQKPLIKMIATLAFKLVAGGAALWAFGKAINMTIMALSATMVVLKGVVALFSLLVAIPKVAIAGLALLTLNLVASRNEWSKWSNHVADTWGAMKNNMSAAMTGVIAALQAANLDLAMEILVAGLELIWEDFWFWIKDGFKTTFSWIIRQFSQITNGIARWSVQAESLWNKLFPPTPPNMDRGSDQWRKWRNEYEKNNRKEVAEMRASANASAKAAEGFGYKSGHDILDDMIWEKYVEGYGEKVGAAKATQLQKQADILTSLGMRMAYDPNWSPQDEAREKHAQKMRGLEAKLHGRVNEALKQKAEADARYNAETQRFSETMKAKREEFEEPNVTIPNIDDLELGNETGGGRAGILRGLTGAFNTAAAVRVAMSAMLPPVAAVDERNASANERSADILQKIDRKLAGVGLTE